MKPKSILPTGSQLSGWPDNIDADQIVKAEAKCLIGTEQLEDGTSAVMKMYCRRGFANFIRAKILNFRAQREFRILRHLANCGVACTLPLFWTHGYCKAYGFYELLCTRFLPNTIPLKTFLSSASPDVQNSHMGPLFQSVYNMHRCGVYHGALSTKNILIDVAANAQARAYHIDLARGWLFPDSILGKRIAWFDLFKLVRTIESHLGRGYCRPHLAHYGFGEKDIQNFYQEAYRYESLSRKQKRVKNTLKIKVFVYAILTQLNQRVKRPGSGRLS